MSTEIFQNCNTPWNFKKYYNHCQKEYQWVLELELTSKKPKFWKKIILYLLIIELLEGLYKKITTLDIYIMG